MLYLSRSKNGHLLLSKKKPPTKWSSKPNPNKVIWNYGQVFHLRNEIPGSEIIRPEDENGNRDFIKASLQVIEDDDPRWINPLYVTRGDDGSLMLHYEEVPTRMRDSEEYRLRKTRKSSIKKDGRKWTSWRGHFRVQPFTGSEHISFDDERPCKVIVVIKK